MAEAILAGVVKEGLLDPSKITVYDVSRERWVGPQQELRRSTHTLTRHAPSQSNHSPTPPQPNPQPPNRLDYVKRTFGVTPASSVAATCAADLTVVCVKPQNLPSVWGAMRKHLKPSSVLLSIVAGGRPNVGSWLRSQ